VVICLGRLVGLLLRSYEVEESNRVNLRVDRKITGAADDGFGSMLKR